MIENSIIITKEENGNVTVSAPGGEYTLNPSSVLTKELDSVIVRGPDNDQIDDFTVFEVEKLVDSASSPGEIPINDVDTLFTELNQNFFFEQVGATPVPPGSSSVFIFPKVQTLNNGDNTIIHNLGKSIISFSVKSGVDVIEATGNDIDLNSFNINISGGGPIVNAEIYLNYL